MNSGMWMRLHGQMPLALLMVMVMVMACQADVTISAAISLKGVLEKAKPELEKAAGEPMSFNFGASGTLAGQIKQGAPVDLFISADRANVAKLVEAGACDKATVQTVAGNSLVLVVPTKKREAAPEIAGFADLAKEGVKRVAIGEPKVVPAGGYAKETLTSMKLWEGLEKAGVLIMTESVAQVLTYVARGEVDAGLVYATDAKASAEVKVVATAEKKLHGAIEYVGAIVSKSQHRAGAEAVQKALGSEGVRKIFAEAGFKVGESGAGSQKSEVGRQ